MNMPFLKVLKNRTERYIVNFGGLNYGEGYSDGDLADCRNLSSEKFPCISPRRQRVEAGSYTNPTTIHAKGGLLVVDGKSVLYKGKEIGTLLTEGKRQIAAVGNYVCIFPDKVYCDVSEKEPKLLDMGIEYQSAGMVFTDKTITTIGADWAFRVGDAVEISGCTEEGNNQTIIVRGVEGKVLTFYENSFTPKTESSPVKLTRKIPDLEFVCESNYRLWGVSGNTIYGSKYMDPLNFFFNDMSAGDSYAIDVGTDGAWTGCIPYGQHICFFKENVLHKLYGSKPSNYQLVTANVHGVQAGSERSLCAVNEQLVYKGVHGVYAYNGGVPDLLTAKFGFRRFTDGVAACDGEKYYISMKEKGAAHLYVYDLLKGVWLEEDDADAIDMVCYDGDVYMLCADGTLHRIDREASHDDVEWSATFCTFNETVDERKGYSRFSMRVDMAAGAWLSVDVKTDRDAQWHEVYTTHNERACTIAIPIRPTRCDSVSIRIRGQGECAVKAFVREFTVGSDV